VIPRFTFTATNDLRAEPDLFGIETATDATHGHFDDISSYQLAIGAAKQDLSVAFTAEGFRASSMTAIEAVAGGVPPEQPQSFLIHIDRPFGFVATTTDNLVLIAGWVDDPDEYSWEEAGYERGEFGWTRKSD
jgi:serine protease inhibitor